MKHFAALALVVALAGPVPAQNLFQRLFTAEKEPDGKTDAGKEDAAALRSAGLKGDDPAGLVGYFRQRTLSEADAMKIQDVIRRMGDESFAARAAASLDVEKFGPAAISPLRTAAQNDADPEVAFRAGETLKRMETVSHTNVALAAARALAKAKPPTAAAALLGYLPLADSPAVEEEIRAALVGLAVRDGSPEPAFVAALTDPNPIRRGAAAVALIDGGPAGKPIRIPAAFAQVKAALAAEADADTKFRIAFALLTTARDADGVAVLIQSLPDVPRGRVWQAEDYLTQLAGKDAPPSVFGNKEALLKARDAWAKWWTTAKPTAKLEAFAYAPKTTGKLLLVSTNPNGWGNAKVAELGPDGKETWRMLGVQAPADARFDKDGRLFVMEQSYNRITERDRSGKILVTRQVDGQPIGFQVLDNGNMLVAHRHMLAEYEPVKWEVKQRYQRNQHDLLAARRMPNGETLVLVQNPPSLIRLDDKWKELPNPVRIGQPFWQARLELAGDDRVLVTEQQRVAEYDLKTGKEMWKAAAQQPSSAQRLGSGNTLIVEYQANVVKEVNPAGETVWSYQPTDGMRLLRAERR